MLKNLDFLSRFNIDFNKKMLVSSITNSKKGTKPLSFHILIQSPVKLSEISTKLLSGVIGKHLETKSEMRLMLNWMTFSLNAKTSKSLMCNSLQKEKIHWSELKSQSNKVKPKQKNKEQRKSDLTSVLLNQSPKRISLKFKVKLKLLKREFWRMLHRHLKISRLWLLVRHTKCWWIK